jgi:hypothetical protein
MEANFQTIVVIMLEHPLKLFMCNFLKMSYTKTLQEAQSELEANIDSATAMHLSYPSQEDSCIYVFRTMENTM